MMMFGTGPFISIPYTVNSVERPGPHALVGYSIALVACICDSLICGELGSMFPYSGGSATYLKYLYGGNSLGQLAAFMFLFQLIVAGPAEVANGFIAIAEYLVHRSNKEICWVFVTLPVITIGAVILAIIFGFANCNNDYLKVN